MYCVYKHTSPSGKVYIGITSRTLSLRCGRGSGYKTNDHFWKAIEKYGWDSFSHEIVAENLTKEDACILEQHLIKEYDSTNPDKGYNSSTGGELSAIGVKCSDERREKIRQSRLGEKHWFYGKHLSEEHRRKIGMASKGRVHTEKTKEKQRDIATKLRGKAVLCVETNIIYPSTAEAARQTSIDRTGIVAVLHKKRKTAGGYHWRYVS